MFKVFRENWRAILETTMISLISIVVIVGFVSMVNPYQ